MTLDLLKPADDGQPDERLSTALMTWATADGDTTPQLAEVAAALCAARVYVPAVEAEPGHLGLVGLRRSDGMTAVPAFTGIERLTAWRADARPLPHNGAELARTAQAEGYSVMVVDIDGPVTATLPLRILTGVGD